MAKRKAAGPDLFADLVEPAVPPPETHAYAAAAAVAPRGFDHDGWNGTLAGYWHQVEKLAAPSWQFRDAIGTGYCHVAGCKKRGEGHWVFGVIPGVPVCILRVCRTHATEDVAAAAKNAAAWLPLPRPDWPPPEPPPATHEAAAPPPASPAKAAFTMDEVRGMIARGERAYAEFQNRERRRLAAGEMHA